MDVRYLVSGSRDKTLRFWDLEERECVYILNGDFGRFIPLAVDEHYIYTYSPTKGIIVWDWQTRELAKKIECNLGTSECAITVDANHLYAGSYLANGNDQCIGIWSKQNWTLETVLQTGQGKFGGCSRLILDGGRLYALCLLDLIGWNLWDRKEILRWEPIEADVYTFSIDPNYFFVGPFVFSRQDHQLQARLLEKDMHESHFVENDDNFVYMTSDERCARIWQKGTWKLHRKIILPGKKHIEGLALSRDNIFLGDESGNITIWSKEDGHCEQVLKGHSDWIWNLAVF